jgi:hypothetical protein
MTINSNNPVAMATLGALVDITTPAAPTISLAAGTGQIVASITGDAGATHTLLYKALGDSAWSAGGSRSGDGDITVSSLSNSIVYIFVAYSQIGSGANSAPAPAMGATLGDSTDYGDYPIADQYDEGADVLLEIFGESATYKPAGGGSRSIQAIIDRDDAAALVGLANSPLLIVRVKNSTTEGISASEIDTGGDKINLVVRLGETAQDRNITRILSQDQGMLELETR